MIRCMFLIWRNLGLYYLICNTSFERNCTKKKIYVTEMMMKEMYFWKSKWTWSISNKSNTWEKIKNYMWETWLFKWNKANDKKYSETQFFYVN